MSKRKFDDDVFEYTGKGQIVPKKVVKVQFHPSVVEVEEKVFCECNELEEVVLNEGLQSIGYKAFYRCESLQNITIPSTVTEIGDWAFHTCWKLKRVAFSKGLQKIGSSAFNTCRRLQRIILPSTVTEIDEGAFWHCTNLKEVVFNEGLKKIKGSSTFWGCSSLESVTIPSTVTQINDYAFMCCGSLKDVTLHDRIQMGKCPFSECTQPIRLSFSSISKRLDSIIRAGHYPRVEAKIDEVRGAVERRGSDMFLPVPPAMKLPYLDVADNDANFDWRPFEDSLDKIVKRIRYYEVNEATTLLELALWKFNMVRDDNKQENRDAYRVEVLGPVKDTILHYLG